MAGVAGTTTRFLATIGIIESLRGYTDTLALLIEHTIPMTLCE